MMHPERFPGFAVLQKYAECHGLEFVWEGTNAFAKRRHSLSPDQFEIVEVQTTRGTSRALLFSKDILVAEWLAE
jgi:hypothetical protein